MGKIKLVAVKKVLLLDTNFSSAPIFNYLIKKKLNVFVIGNNPDDYLAKKCLNYFRLNYSDLESVNSLIIKEGINYIVPGCNDLSYEICCKLNENRKYFGIENLLTCEIIYSKELFREFALQNELPVPKIYSPNKRNFRFPVIIKPVDSFSGKGVTIIDKKNSAKCSVAFKNALNNSKKRKFLVEEFVEGELFSHSAFIKNKKIYKDFIVAEYCRANNFAVDTSYVVNDFSQQILKKIRDAICLLSKKLNLIDGLIHTQFILSKNKKSFWIIEVTRRCPGDLYSQLIEMSTGYPYAEEYTKYFLGINKINNSKNKFSTKIIRHTITSKVEDNFGFLEFAISISIKKYISILNCGEIIQIAPKGRIGIIFIEALKSREFNIILASLLNRTLYKILNYI